ncbi:ABC transporter substrate-binding protein [Halobiforma nitratireducens]|uniref:Carbohydrate ABC transporter substrate-binding protein, CUT1 family n=1 Tax=Halobiforma nitratireducens JCM 10879 TaxID=1227454 RepID=M0MMK8_9EURY|nr:ABC transporter substrate-binding protein [Halobiforma nitratireducens]EMA46588.1 carbohydrate ABC transporter substrate-binding protein, CUT1 family [Halobiforma nitratireducens JCM 10879]
MSADDPAGTRRTFLEQVTAGGAATATALTAGCLGSLPTDVLGDDEIEIDVWHGLTGGLEETFADLTLDFNRSREDITVRLTGYDDGYDQVFTETRGAVTEDEGDPPEVAMFAEIGTRQAIDSGQFVPMEDVVPDLPTDDFIDPILDYYRVDGTLHSMPFNPSHAFMMINRDAFEAADLNPDDPPRSFEGVADAAEAMVEADAVDHGVTCPNISWFIEQWFAAQNAELVNNENGRAGPPTESNLTSDAAATIYEWWHDLDERGVFHVGDGWFESEDAFANGTAGILLYSTASISTLLERATQEGGFEADAAYFPAPGGDQTGLAIGGASLWVPEAIDDDRQSAAAEFLTWLTDPTQQSRWHRETGYFPVREESVDELEQEGWFDANPDYRVVFDQLTGSASTTATQGAMIGPFPEVRTEIEGIWTDIEDGTSVQDALADGKERVDDQLTT